MLATYKQGFEIKLNLRGELLFVKATARDRAVEYVESGLCAPDIYQANFFK